MIRKTLFALAAVAAIAGAASSAQAGGYGYGYGWNWHAPVYHAPVYKAPRFIRKCHTKIIGYKKFYSYSHYRWVKKPIFKKFCKKIAVYH